ncbi:MAG: enoyl-CoA hydratase [Alphaproteobacteria bacterium]|jgi:enoyl-CoA hydratase/carnithine racemase|nr:enoyl-CoA hydratase [Alphaproteobacteria bacterium]|tara:strand:+ start:1580 stop:2386 length:807 start_codon:yes stop_codon:yes gene_type:complete
MAEMLTLDTDLMIARKDAGIGWMIFNNPERRNALKLEMWQAVSKIIADFAADDTVRTVIMAGAGDKAFVSGADISEFEKHRDSAEAEEEYNRVTATAQEALGRLEKPLVAMIRGFCVGGGLAVALQADIRIASDDSQYAIPAARLGLGYGFTGLRKLSTLVGPAMAKEILFTARLFSAEEALRMGLINRLVPAPDLKATVRQLAEGIADNAPLTVRAAKVAIGEVLKDPDNRDLEAVEHQVRACFDSEDYTEGRTAFMEKRRPQFKGR